MHDAKALAKTGWNRDWFPQPKGKDSHTVQQFVKYAKFLLAEFGEVDMWTTFNEPWCATVLSSGWGKAPSIQPYFGQELWPYVAAHNIIVAHSLVAEVFAASFGEKKQLGMVMNMDFRQPLANTTLNRLVAAEVLVEQLAMFADPIYGRASGSGIGGEVGGSGVAAEKEEEILMAIFIPGPYQF